MKKFSSPLYIEERVNVTPEDTQEAQSLALDTDTILKLIDLLFLGREDNGLPLS